MHQTINQLETARWWHWAALLTAMVFPTLTTWIYFGVLSEAAMVQPVYALSKVVQFDFPVAWVWWMQKRRIGWHWPSAGDMGLGAPVGAAMVAAGLAAYYGFFRDSAWLANAPQTIREKITHLGIATPGKYWAFALFVSVPH